MSEAGSYFLRLEDLLFPGIVTLLAAFQLADIATRVGAIRKKLKIAYPAISGDPAFERAYRAQQNTLEFHPIFMSCLWVSSLFFHPGAASCVGIVYMYSRHKYFDGYCKSVEGRVSGFYLSTRCLKIYLVMGVCGLATMGLRKYTGIDLAEMACTQLHKILPWK